MKKTRFLLLWALSAIICSPLYVNAQDKPGDYLTQVNNMHVEMNQKYMEYMSAVAHGSRARKVEKLRQQTLSSITAAMDKTVALPFYKGDNSIRQSSLDYIRLCNNVFNEDYGKIVNMEEIAEQSIDQMEAYLLLKEKTNEKLHQAGDKMEQAVKDFAARYNIRLTETRDELSDKMEKAGKLNHYQNQVFIIFFKCNFQESQMVKAMKEKKVNDIEQSRTALLKYADEGLKELEALRTFEGDARLSNACKQLLDYYKKSAENNVPRMLEFYLKQDNFEKLKKNMEANASRTKQDVDAYNAAVKEINNASNQFNQMNANANNSRNQLMQNWEQTQAAFADAHMPHYKS